MNWGSFRCLWRNIILLYLPHYFEKRRFRPFTWQTFRWRDGHAWLSLWTLRHVHLKYNFYLAIKKLIEIFYISLGQIDRVWDVRLHWPNQWTESPLQFRLEWPTLGADSTKLNTGASVLFLFQNYKYNLGYQFKIKINV